MRLPLLLTLLCLSFASLSQQSEQQLITKVSQAQQRWVIVFDDPRPARLQGWVRGNYGKGSSNYKAALELARFSKKISSRYGLELHDEWFIPSLEVYCLVVSFKNDQSVTLSRLKQDKAVQSIQLSNDFELLNERERLKPANSDKEGAGLDDRLPNLIDGQGVDGQGVVIAIVDSAVDGSHKDLAGSINTSKDFVVVGKVDTRSSVEGGESHGTAIAGVMITQRDTKLGVVGISPAARVEAYRGCWESVKLNKTNCNTLSLARALDAVARGEADILNLSLSGPRDVLLDRILQRIIDRGTMVVAAFDPSRPSSERFPLERDGVLIVRAHGLDDGYKNVFSAPGARVVPRPGNNYDFMHGHSVATAYTSGLFALRKQALSKTRVAKNRKNDWRKTPVSNKAADLVTEIFQKS